MKQLLVTLVILTINGVQLVKATTEPNAGVNQFICNAIQVYLNANEPEAWETGIWTSSGSGSFEDANKSNTVYYPSNDDKTAGSVALTWTINCDTCESKSDDMLASFGEIYDPEISVFGDSVCHLGSGEVRVTFDNPDDIDISLNWYLNGELIDSATEDMTREFINLGQSISVKVELISNYRCFTTVPPSDEVGVHVLPEPVAIISPDNEIPVELTAIYTAGEPQWYILQSDVFEYITIADKFRPCEPGSYLLRVTNPLQCADSALITITEEQAQGNECVSAIINDVLISELEVFPNPARDFARLNFQSIVTDKIALGIYDLQGREFIKKQSFEIDPGKNTIHLDLEELDAGVYVIRIEHRSNHVRDLIQVLD